MAPFFMVRTHKSDAKAPMIGDNGKFETATGIGTESKSKSKSMATQRPTTNLNKYSRLGEALKLLKNKNLKNRATQ